jgi:hypothetical protein
LSCGFHRSHTNHQARNKPCLLVIVLERLVVARAGFQFLRLDEFPHGCNK